MGIAKRLLPSGEVRYQGTDRSRGFKSLSRTFYTRREALAWRAHVKVERARGQEHDPGHRQSMTLGDAIGKYVAQISKRKFGAKQEEGVARRWQRHPLAQRYIGDILPYDLDAYVQERLDAGRAGNTVNIELSFISQVYTWVRRKMRMYSLVNPVIDVDKPERANVRDRRLSTEEELLLLAYFVDFGNPQMCSIVRFAMETGLRKSELLRLRWDDVDLKQRWATVVQARKGKRPPKSPTRSFALTEEAVAVLKAHAATRGGPTTGLVFDMSSNAIDMARKKALKATGIKDWRFHDCRHEAASRLIVMGVDLELVRRQLGHKNLQMTQSYVTVHKHEMLRAIR